MMFNCIKHGWTSFEKPCTICSPVVTFSSNSATGAIIGVSGSSWSELHEQIEFLKAENARYREALEFYANPDNYKKGVIESDLYFVKKITGAAITHVSIPNTITPDFVGGRRAREALKGE